MANKPGRPKGGTAFRPEFVEQAKKLCRLGAIDDEMAGFFGVTVTTFHNWKHAHPEFKVALDEAKAKGWTVVDMKNEWKQVFAKK